jgi:hypothetical protein
MTSKIFPPTFPFRHSRLVWLGHSSVGLVHFSRDHSLRVAVRTQNPQYVDNAVVPSSRVEPDFPASGTLLFHVCNHPPLISLSVIRSRGVGGCGLGWHPSRLMFFSQFHQAGSTAPFSSCIIGRVDKSEFFPTGQVRAFHAPSPNPAGLVALRH